MKKTQLKRILSVVLTLAMLFTMTALPAGAFAASSYAATPTDDNSGAQNRNIERVVSAINGYTLVNGAQFSFNHAVGDRSKERGYENALNGRGVKTYGGGSGQVAATIYLAIKNMKGIRIDKLSTYGDRYDGDYVESGDDAVVVDWKTGTDFAFTNKTGKTLTMYIWLDDDEVRVSIEENDTMIGYGTTTIYGGKNKLSNIKLAASAVDGTQLGYNDVFSFNDIVGARTKSNGYKNAVNGRSVKVVGGGVAQVASAIWLAIKDNNDIKIIEKSTYGKRYTETYVDDGDDAIVTDYSAGTDFRFRYKGDGVITINCYVQNDDTLVCEITSEDAVG